MILEMNAAPTPKWIELFQKYIEFKLDVDRVTSTEIIGNLCRIKRQNKEPINEGELDELAWDEAVSNKTFDTESEWVNGFKAGYRRRAAEE